MISWKASTVIFSMPLNGLIRQSCLVLFHKQCMSIKLHSLKKRNHPLSINRLTVPQWCRLDFMQIKIFFCQRTNGHKSQWGLNLQIMKEMMCCSIMFLRGEWQINFLTMIGKCAIKVVLMNSNLYIQKNENKLSVK